MGQKLNAYLLNAKIADVGLSRFAPNGFLSHMSKVCQCSALPPPAQPAFALCWLQSQVKMPQSSQAQAVMCMPSRPDLCPECAA